MNETLLEIIELSRQNGLNPVSEIKNYLEEKDSHITWHEAERLVERLTRNQKTTIKARSPLLEQPDEVQTAQNAFAVAVKNFTGTPTEENRLAMEKAQNELLQVQEAYREGRESRLQFVQAQLQKATGRRP